MNRSIPLDSRHALNPKGIRAYLRTEGYAVTGSLLSYASCSRVSNDVGSSVALGPAASGCDTVRALALLDHSDASMNILNDESFGLLIDEVVGANVVLSRAEGFMTLPESKPAWRRDFDRVLRAVPSQRFSPGLTALIPLDETPGQLEIIRSSHLLKSESPLTDPPELLKRVVVPQGCAALLAAGVFHRHCSASSTWLSFIFIRPWIKPEILLASALQPDRIPMLSPRGRRWCGFDVGLPTSVAEFLKIEAIALDSDFGRGKGSGI
jgi:hypothetical protein